MGSLRRTGLLLFVEGWPLHFLTTSHFFKWHSNVIRTRWIQLHLLEMWSSLTNSRTDAGSGSGRGFDMINLTEAENRPVPFSPWLMDFCLWPAWGRGQPNTHSLLQNRDANRSLTDPDPPPPIHLHSFITLQTRRQCLEHKIDCSHNWIHSSNHCCSS